MRSRGTTPAELDQTLTRILASLKKRVDPEYQHFFRCAGGCEDTGWVVVDDGLALNGTKRVRAAVVRRCSKCGGSPARRVSEVHAGGSFS